MAFNQSAHNRLSSCTFNDTGRDQITLTIVNHGTVQLLTTGQPETSSNPLSGLTSSFLTSKSPSSSVFSTIDITTNLIVEIINLLRAERLVQLERDLSSLCQSLTLVKLAVEAYQFTPLEANLAKTVYPELDGCRNVLQKTLDEINRYQATLRPTRIYSLSVKVWWRGMDVEKLASSAKTLLIYQKHLNAFLQALNSYVFSDFSTQTTVFSLPSTVYQPCLGRIRERVECRRDTPCKVCVPVETMPAPYASHTGR